jgi:hypothetical protein
MLDTLQSDNFSALLNEPFLLVPVVWGQAYDPAQHGPLRRLILSEVELLGQLKQSAPRAQAFSLLFYEESRTVLPQQIYSLQHSSLGQIDIFLVPVGNDSQRVYYQAIFN